MTGTAKTTRTIGSGDDLITYDVRGDLSTATPERPALLMFASPMDASAFDALASHFTDRPVITYDARGAGRNPRATSPMDPEMHAEDLHRIIQTLGVGAVDAFGTSGGAINLLTLAIKHPEDLRVAVAHEPPTINFLPDREQVLSALRDLTETYQRAGSGPAMAKFVALVMQRGELPADYLDRPAPAPEQFGMSSEDDGSRTEPLMRNMPACNEYELDVDALRSLGARLVIAVGADSGDEIAARGGRTVAQQLGAEVVVFPSHHAGFVADGFGQPGDPDAFAAKLREVLDRA